MTSYAVIHKNPNRLLIVASLVFVFSGAAIIWLLLNYHPFKMMPHSVEITQLHQEGKELSAVLNTGKIILEPAHIYRMKIASAGKDYFIPLKIMKGTSDPDAATGYHYQVQITDIDTVLRQQKTVNGIIYIQETTKINLLKTLFSI